MKNSFKLAFVALALATTFSACNGKEEGSNDTTTTVVDSNVTVDSNITVDSNVKIDSNTSADTASKM